MTHIKLVLYLQIFYQKLLYIKLQIYYKRLLESYIKIKITSKIIQIVQRHAGGRFRGEGSRHIPQKNVFPFFQPF